MADKFENYKRELDLNNAVVNISPLSSCDESDGAVEVLIIESNVEYSIDNGITWHLIYNPNNKLQHGDSYNWDLFLNGFCNLINGLLGLPWLVAHRARLPAMPEGSESRG